jgi:hypothetical protein
VEGDAYVRIRSWRAVLLVAFDRTAKVGKLAADLMMASCKEVHLDEPGSDFN